jgi:hypothetical protein
MPEVLVERGKEEGRVYVKIGGAQIPSKKTVMLINEHLKEVKMSTVVNLLGCPEHSDIFSNSLVVHDQINYMPSDAKVMIANPTIENFMLAVS